MDHVNDNQNNQDYLTGKICFSAANCNPQKYELIGEYV